MTLVNNKLKKDDLFVPDSVVCDFEHCAPYGSLYEPCRAPDPKRLRIHKKRLEWLWALLLVEVHRQKTNQVVIPVGYVASCYFGPKYNSVQVKQQLDPLVKSLPFKPKDVEIKLSKELMCDSRCIWYCKDIHHLRHYVITIPHEYLGGLHSPGTVLETYAPVENQSRVFKYRPMVFAVVKRNSGERKICYTSLLVKMFGNAAGLTSVEVALMQAILLNLARKKRHNKFKSKVPYLKAEAVSFLSEETTWFVSKGNSLKIKEGSYAMRIRDWYFQCGLLQKGDLTLSVKDFREWVKAVETVESKFGIYAVVCKRGAESLKLTSEAIKNLGDLEYFARLSCEKQLVLNFYVPSSFKNKIRSVLEEESGLRIHKKLGNRGHSDEPEGIDFVIKAIHGTMVERKTSVKDLHRLCGVTYTHLLSIFAGRCIPRYDTLVRIMNSLNLPVDTLDTLL